jgi:tripartite-type tricarboxylate transporter receptor subunit TctC
MFGAYPAAAEQIKAGKLRALAVGSPERIESLPEVPTLTEAGYGNIEADLWTWLLAPAKTPNEAVVELSNWFSGAMKAPEIKAKLAVQGLFPVAMCGAEFAARMRKESESYSRIIREANIKLE